MAWFRKKDGTPAPAPPPESITDAATKKIMEELVLQAAKVNRITADLRQVGEILTREKPI